MGGETSNEIIGRSAVWVASNLEWFLANGCEGRWIANDVVVAGLAFRRLDAAWCHWLLARLAQLKAAGSPAYEPMRERMLEIHAAAPGVSPASKIPRGYMPPRPINYHWFAAVFGESGLPAKLPAKLPARGKRR